MKSQGSEAASVLISNANGEMRYVRVPLK
jgi:hypothetical protein